jgi:hypothetical protein
MAIVGQSMICEPMPNLTSANSGAIIISAMNLTGQKLTNPHF